MGVQWHSILARLRDEEELPELPPQRLDEAHETSERSAYELPTYGYPPVDPLTSEMQSLGPPRAQAYVFTPSPQSTYHYSPRQQRQDDLGVGSPKDTNTILNNAAMAVPAVVIEGEREKDDKGKSKAKPGEPLLMGVSEASSSSMNAHEAIKRKDNGQKEGKGKERQADAPRISLEKLVEAEPVLQPAPLQRRNTRRQLPLPPQSLLVEPFGGLKSPGTITPSSVSLTNLSDVTTQAPSSPASNYEPTPSEDGGKTEPNLLSKTPPQTRTGQRNKPQNQIDKPTCSLTIVSYSHGCQTSLVRVSLRSKFATKEDFLAEKAKYPKLVTTDRELFLALKERYHDEMCGFWRRWFSLKTLKRFRLLSYTGTTRPFPVPMDEFTMQEVMYAYTHPTSFGDGTDWIEWVFRLRQPLKRHALEFVEGWNGTRIVTVGTLPCIASTLVGVLWTAKGGDAQTAFTVAGFILTVTTVLLALLAVVSGIDSRSLH